MDPRIVKWVSRQTVDPNTSRSRTQQPEDSSTFLGKTSLTDLCTCSRTVASRVDLRASSSCKFCQLCHLSSIKNFWSFSSSPRWTFTSRPRNSPWTQPNTIAEEEDGLARWLCVRTVRDHPVGPVRRADILSTKINVFAGVYTSFSFVLNQSQETI